MVPVQVRDEHGVDAAQAIARRDGLDPAERTDPRPGDRVGQQADPVEVDDDGRVADEVQAQAPGHRQPLRAASGYSRTRRYGSRPRDRETRFARSAIWCWSRRM